MNSGEPLPRPVPAKPSGPGPAVTDPSRNGEQISLGRILLAEDDGALAAATLRILRRAGYHADHASDGARALELASLHAFDAVLADISMPKLDGLGLLRTLHRRDPDLPVVLLTGAPDLDSAIRAIELGAFRYLLKPAGSAELVRAVELASSAGRAARSRRQVLTQLEGRRAAQARGLEQAQRLRAALASLQLVFQPIVRWSRREVHAHEALLRCAEPGLDSALALLCAAEAAGCVHDVGRAVRTALAATLPELATHDVYMNIDARDLLDDHLFEQGAPLSRHAQRVVLEITERAALGGLPDLGGRLSRLRSMGYRIALDDLGAGYSGLSSLAQLDPDVVKLDMSLIRGIEVEPARRRLVGAILNLVRDLRKLVIVEGVESVGERDCLSLLGGDYFQGYLFAAPARPTPAVRW